jgi:hypothetical protein
MVPFRVRSFSWVCVFAAGVALAEPPRNDASQVLDTYLSLSRSHRDRLRGSIAEVSIAAEVPKLNKSGRLNALRRISQLGRLTYDILRFEGDNSVKNHVIARYLSAEAQVREADDASVAIVPENYKFGYKGLRDLDGRQVHLFELKPKAKRKGLFKGHLWIDAATFLPLRESGRFVKNPSIFIKRVEFTRSYRIQNGLAVVDHLETDVQTRVVGPAHMTVQYTDYRFEPPAVDVVRIPTADNQ